MPRLPTSALLFFALVSSSLPTRAATQTLPTLPQLSSAQTWAGEVRGGLTMTSGEVQGRTLTSSGALAFAAGSTNGNLRGFLMFTENEHGSSGTEVRSERYALEASLQVPFRGPAYLAFNGDWERDPTHGFDHRLFGSLGLGASFDLAPAFRLELEGSGGVVREGFSAGDSEAFGGLAALARTHWKLSETASLATELEVIANAGDADDRRHHADIELITAIWGPLQLSVSYLLSHDTDPPLVFDPFDNLAPAAPAEGTVGALTIQVGVSF